MDSQNQGSCSSFKRKRGRPRKDESIVRSEQLHAMPESKKTKDTKQSTDPTGRDDMLGQVVYGVVDGKFDAGYLVKVRVGNTNVHLRGVVFLPGRYVPVTTANDLAPQAIMYERTDIPIPAPNVLSHQSQVSSSNQINKPVEHKELSSTFEGVEQTFEVRNPVLQQNQCASAMPPLANSLAADQGGFSSEKMVERLSGSFGSGMLQDEASEEKNAPQKSTASVENKKAECVDTNEPSTFVSQSSHCGNLVPRVETADQKVQAKHQLASSDQKVADKVKSPTIDHTDTQASAMDIEAPELASKVVIEGAANDPNAEPLIDAANVTTAKSPVAPLNNPSANLSGGYTHASTPEIIIERSTIEGVIAPQVDITEPGMNPTPSTLMETEAVPLEANSKLDTDGSVPPKMTDCE